MKFALLFVVALSSMVTGCAHVKPWERGKLAHHTMANSNFAGPAEEHVNSVHEGAAGGAGGTESGCGCN